MKFRLAIIFGTLWITVSAGAERLLLPIVYNGPGANRSTWGTLVSAVNRTAQPWSSPNVGFVVFNCPIPEGCFTDRLEPNQFGYLAEPGDRVVLSAPGGILLHTPSSGQDIALAYSFSSGDVWGTELPRVREGDFYSGTLLLHSVPAAMDRFRATLRLYALDTTETNLTVHIRGTANVSDIPLVSHSVHLASPHPEATSVFPAFAQLPINLPSQEFGQLVSIEIQGSPQTRFWAFVSVTDNTTNAVRLVTP